VNLTLLSLPVLEHLHGHEGSTAGEQLVAELGLVVILVDLVVVVLGVALRGVSWCYLSHQSELSYRNRTCWLVVCGSWLLKVGYVVQVVRFAVVVKKKMSEREG
jgi:hypothetical protein